MLLALIAGLLAGCIFSPDRRNNQKPPPPRIIYPELSTPQAVLTAIRLAYEGRDSVMYLKLFETDYYLLGEIYGYRGFTYDSTGTLSFTRDDEEKHIQRLAQDATIVSVSLDLGLPGQWKRTSVISGTTGEEWAEITVFNPQVGITELSNSLQTVANETFDFRFRPTVALESSTDTLWHIVELIENSK